MLFYIERLIQFIASSPLSFASMCKNNVLYYWFHNGSADKSGAIFTLHYFLNFCLVLNEAKLKRAFSLDWGFLTFPCLIPYSPFHYVRKGIIILSSILLLMHMAYLSRIYIDFFRLHHVPLFMHVEVLHFFIAQGSRCMPWVRAIVPSSNTFRSSLSVFLKFSRVVYLSDKGPWMKDGWFWCVRECT